MKRWISFILFLCLIVGAMGCSGSSNNPSYSEASLSNLISSDSSSAPSSSSGEAPNTSSKSVSNSSGSFGKINTGIKAVSCAGTIRWNDVLQTVDGFGGSEAFKKSEGLMRLKEPERSRLLDFIFSREKGIGVSILRLMLGDEGNGDAEIIEPHKGVFIWDDPEWGTKKAEFDKGQVWLANEAKKRGVTTFMSTAWSSPAWMKTNNDYKGNGTGRLKQECYQDYADYLAEYVIGYRKYFDLDISYLSIANEPGIAPEYPGCLWSAEDMNSFIRDYLGPTFDKRGLKTKIVMPESMNFDESMAVPALQDPITEKLIDVVATHAYGIGSNVAEFPVSLKKGKQIWQTEYMNQGAEYQTYENNTISDALRYADLIGNMFAKTQINAWFYWWLAANNGADGSDLIRLCTDGDANTPTENGLYRVFKRYYAFGNFSRFIRPGYHMLGADNRPADGVLMTAFKNPATGSFAIVAVNRNQYDVNAKFTLEGFPANQDELAPYRTSASENLSRLGSVKASGGVLSTALKAESITTFIPKSLDLEDFDFGKDVFSVLEAEENDGRSDGIREADCPDGGKMIGDLRDGGYIRYTGVNFGDGTACGTLEKRSVLYMKARVNAEIGGTIEVRLDDPKKGRMVGSMKVTSSGGGEDWVEVTGAIDTKAPDGARGIHDLFLVFKGSGEKELFRIDSFRFCDTEFDW